MPRRERTPSTIAREIRDWVESAVYDAASCQEQMGELDSYDCMDKAGAAADDMYSDPGAMSDLLGDRLCDETRDNTELRSQVIDELKKNMSHLRDDFWDDLRR